MEDHMIAPRPVPRWAWAIPAAFWVLVFVAIVLAAAYMLFGRP